MPDAILHAFNWKFTEIAASAEEIGKIGYGAVLFPPPLYSDETSAPWWQRYQPKDYRIIRSWLGRKADVVNAIQALHKAGVKAFCDVVFNHMANEKGSRPDPYNFPGERELARYKAEAVEFEKDRLYGEINQGLFSPWDFNPEGDIVNWNNLLESQEHWLSGLPDLDLNEWVIQQQRECLKALNALGFDGYRIDAIKHLPLEHLKSVFDTPDMEDRFVFGEALTMNDTEEEMFLWPLLGSTQISFYDFPLLETMGRAFSFHGSLRELVDPAAWHQALPWNRSVTVTITHDIPYNDGFRWQIPDATDEYLALVYLMARDGGVPMIFTDHGESAEKFPEDKGRWEHLWKRPYMESLLRFHNTCHGLPQKELWEDQQVFVWARGAIGIAALNKSGENRIVRLDLKDLRPGKYTELLGKSPLSLIPGHTDLTLPPRSAMVWLWDGV